MLEIPNDIRDAIVVKIREQQRDNGVVVLGWQAHSWLDNVLEEGPNSPFFRVVAPAAMEVVVPVWQQVLPVLRQLWESIAPAVSKLTHEQAGRVIAGTDRDQDAADLAESYERARLGRRCDIDVTAGGYEPDEYGMLTILHNFNSNEVNTHAYDAEWREIFPKVVAYPNRDTVRVSATGYPSAEVSPEAGLALSPAPVARVVCVV
jgi:hypothetical protein